jgi:predicted secreted hydrolase
MRRRRLLPLSGLILALLTLLGACAMPGTIATGGRLPAANQRVAAQPLPPITFPQDEAPHHDLTEWWYYTGHLHGADTSGALHDYGFELTYFQTLRGQFAPYDAAHFAISDITRGQFRYDQRASFEPPSTIPSAGTARGFSLALDGWTARGLNGRDHLHAVMADYALDVALRADKPAVLHGGNGLISYGRAGYSYYYSRTHMPLAGTLLDHGRLVTVTGQAWMDHQWGNFVSLAGSGWDWYSLQLDNHTEYMLYVIRDQQKRPLSVFGTYVAVTGTAAELDSASIHPRPLGTWTSPQTHGVYPSGWEVTLDAQHVTLILTPLLRDQELVTAQSTGVAYWEGAVAIEGTAVGRPITGEGYVELTGYAALPPGAQTGVAP